MILSDEGIKRALADSKIEIDPEPSPEHYSPSAVDIAIGDASTFKCWKLDAILAAGVDVILNLEEQNYAVTAQHYATAVRPENDGSVVLPPYSDVHQVILCQTHQRLHLKPESRLAARVEGRSSLARFGLMVHLTAPTIHAGFNGTITLEMVNHGPFHLKFVPFQTRVCQFIFEKLETEPEIDIQTGFQNQVDPLGGA